MQSSVESEAFKFSRRTSRSFTLPKRYFITRNRRFKCGTYRTSVTQTIRTAIYILTHACATANITCGGHTKSRCSPKSSCRY